MTLVLVYISECERLVWEVLVCVMSEHNCVRSVSVLCVWGALCDFCSRGRDLGEQRG